MKYIKLNADKFVEVDETKNNAKVLVRENLETTRAAIVSRLNEISQTISDEELLKWARQNYPQMDYTAEVNQLKSELSEIDKQLASIERM